MQGEPERLVGGVVEVKIVADKHDKLLSLCSVPLQPALRSLTLSLERMHRALKYYFSRQEQDDNQAICLPLDPCRHVSRTFGGHFVSSDASSQFCKLFQFIDEDYF